jgi:HSP20 family molecular chaperone IbpA
MERMKLKMDEQMARMRQEMRMLLPASAGGGQLIRLDEKQMEQYFDDSHKRIKFDVDVQEFANETVVVKSDGNKIEVHAKKFVKKGDDEQTEEYSRTYELPSGVDTKMVTSSLQKDGNLLTIELPV